MRQIMRFLCAVSAMLAGAVFAGEILYQDYLGEDELFTAQDQLSSAMLDTAFEWNYLLASNSLSVVMKIKYGLEEGTNVYFRPIVAQYKFKDIHERPDKSVCRADACFQHLIMPTGFCMVGLDSFLFSHGSKQSPKTSYLRLDDSAQIMRDITQEVNGGILMGALSASERAIFPDGEGFVFQCVENANRWGLFHWNNGACSLWPVDSKLRGYACLSGRRVLLNYADNNNRGDLYSMSILTKCRHLLPCCNDGNCRGDGLWSITRHKMNSRRFDNEVGQELVEGSATIYDFYRWTIGRISRNESFWQFLDLKEYFREEMECSDDWVACPILHRGTSSWYYALLFEKANRVGRNDWHYQMKIMEVLHDGEGLFIWEFPSFHTPKKLTTDLFRSPAVVHKLPDDSWVVLSNTVSFTNDAIFVQRMTGNRKVVKPNFKAASWGKLEVKRVSGNML